MPKFMKPLMLRTSMQTACKGVGIASVELLFRVSLVAAITPAALLRSITGQTYTKQVVAMN